MLITTEKLKALYPQFAEFNDELLTLKLEAIESAIRAYTHNTFQNRAIRAYCEVNENTITLIKGNWLFKAGDTVSITTEPNSGLYTVLNADSSTLTVDKDLYPSEAIVTLVKYPNDVVTGAINILSWDCFDRDNIGVSSETISRHSVTYTTYDGNNTINGYPAMLFGFCNPYIQMRT